MEILFFALIGVLLAFAVTEGPRILNRIIHGKPPPIRDVSGLADAGEGDASVKEEIISAGAPLKPGHRRLALRDPRLLPKPKPKQDRFQWPRPKKQRYLSEAEADRLFSATMRTRNRNVRDLTVDQEQLRRYGLPVWKTEEELAAALGLSLKQLHHLATHRIRDLSPHYITFSIPKRSGGERLIHAPKTGLKAVLRRVNDRLVSRLPVSPYAHGFVKGRSVATNAAIHAGKAVVIKFDIKDCFPSIHFGRVRGLLIALGYPYPVAASLAVLMTEAPRQPVKVENKLYHVPVGRRFCVQGAPTSPGLCNAVLRRLDHRLAGLAARHSFSFTRYADDLTFSGNDRQAIGDLRNGVETIVAAEGFELNGGKTRIMRKGGRQTVTGVVVNDAPGLSRKERRKMRAAIHQLGKQGASEADRARLAGKIAYLHMLNDAQAEPLLKQLRTATGAGR
jgi:hypothetical protein